MMMIYSNGSGQGVPCSGPLNITVQGSESGTPLDVEQYTYDIFCLGLDEGAIDLIISGGSPEYISTWSTGEDTPELSNLYPGSYTVTVLDGKDCSDTITFNIEEINPLEFDMTLVEGDGCGLCTLSDGGASYFYSEIDYMVYVEDVENGDDLGEIQICTEVHNETYWESDIPFLQRSWCLDSDGGDAVITLYFSDEELKQLMADAEVEYIKSANLFVKVYSGGNANLLDHEIELTIDDISMTLFDNINNIWSVQFTVKDLPTPSACFYIQYLRDESQKTIDELTAFVEKADFRIIGNPVVETVNLEINHLSCVLSGNIYIEDDIQQLIYKESFVNSRLGIISIDVSEYPAAMYFLTIEFPNANISKTFKFIKIVI